MTLEELRNNNWKDSKGLLWNDPNSNDWINYTIDDIIEKRWKIVPGWFINGVDSWVCRDLDKFLQSHGRSQLEYYTRFILNSYEIPKCANPNCNNLVRMRDRKFSHGITNYCCWECQFGEGSPHNQKISESMVLSWQDPNSGLNSENWRLARKENARNLFLDPEHQAYLQIQRIQIYNSESSYGFYLARTEFNKLKFGITKYYDLNYRKEIQDIFYRERYLNIHGLYRSSGYTMSCFEWDIKSKFNFQEFIDWKDFPKLKSIIKNLLKEDHYKNITKFND